MNISIIIPLFKVEQYLNFCLDSIISQTYTDIEIILVDDGSPDRSGEIADEYACKDNRIKVIHKENGGLSSARNAGLSIATGEYVAFIDSDDWIDERMIEKMYHSAIENDSDIVICGVCVEFTRENRLENCYSPKASFSNNNNNFGLLSLALQRKKLFNYACNKLYKKSMLKASCCCFKNLMPAEDLLFNYEVFKRAKTISIVEDCLYHYMRRDTITILSSYHPTILNISQQVIFETESFYDYFLLKEKCAKELSYIKVNYGQAVIKLLYHRESPFDRRGRIEMLSNEIYANEMISNNLSSYIPKNVLDNLYLFNYKYLNPVLMDLLYSFLFFLRNRFLFVYCNFRYFLR